MVDIYQILDKLGINYQKFDHPPVFTVLESKKLRQEIPGAQTKNLFCKSAEYPAVSAAGMRRSQ
ncbi:MAG: hypothetical protein A2729_06085 [Candidatus Buchananbacteria bacterium RIFCSPHIGHO2_01_FULL_39_14]|uniref:YbaK/aminoacyl-tRNA synthetase-associated domain-containing protein n=2 Tax=Candidatus Buchananiibacteriota TaxID=1817903 RepID=A0A1G1YLV8_9BACT|nr:MAG: hypothetical protein A2729_06085 [Candidatus Buchananbacteria bacterium RIFCSPHIGHO2_01_FULL_39_14]OGY53343.1 MAG: hypothetical protein A2912_05255 [Candidatus Buchananbacteria bacterium RIFCSPLOWO2_01_FULL_40_23b]